MRWTQTGGTAINTGFGGETMEGLGVDRKIILKNILKKQDGRVPL
jgi:hypothetical protein